MAQLKINFMSYSLGYPVNIDMARPSFSFDDLPGYGHEFTLWDMDLKRSIEWLPRTDHYADKGIHQI